VSKIDIALNKIELSGENARKSAHKKNGSLDDLTKSVKEFGVIVPIIVRPHPKKKDHYELRAGERRFFASKAAKLETIPAVVLDVDDKRANEITYLENEKRLDLDLEESIGAVQQLIKTYGKDAKAIGDRLGLTEHQVKLRMNALNLSKGWKKVLARNEMSVTAEHLDIIARMPHEIQDDAIRMVRSHLYYGEQLTVKQLEKLLADNYTHALKGAAWDLDLKIGKLKACNDCTMRSDCKGQTDFWKEKPTSKTVAICLNPFCWNQKLIEHIVQEHKSVAAATKLTYVLPEKFNSQTIRKIAERLDLEPRSIDKKSDYKSCKQSTKDAVCLFDLTTGKASYGVLKTKAQAVAMQGKKNPVTGNTVGKVKSLAERKQDHKGLRMKLMLAKIHAAVEACAEPVDKSLKYAAALCAVLDISSSRTVPGREKSDLQKVKEIKDAKTFTFGSDWRHEDRWEVDLAGALWLKARETLASRMKFDGPGTKALKHEAEAKEICEVIGFDWNKGWKEVCEEKPDPKIWQTLKADGTKK